MSILTLRGAVRFLISSTQDIRIMIIYCIVFVSKHIVQIVMLSLQLRGLRLE